MSFASSAIKRLSNEYRHIQKPENRVSDYYVAPLEENIFEWHFTLRGPAGNGNSLPYKDGLYHGALIFSRSYPLEPPDIMFFTRSGRFATHEKICSTISSYHKELWQPTYDVALTLTALRHFMAQEDEFGVGAFPKNMVAVETKLAWAKETWSFACATCGRSTKEVWETEMQMYPETSAEKEAMVPKLPSVPAASALPGKAGKEEEGGALNDTRRSTSPLPPAAAAAPAASTAVPSSSSPKPVKALSSDEAVETKDEREEIREKTETEMRESPATAPAVDKSNRKAQDTPQSRTPILQPTALAADTSSDPKDEAAKPCPAPPAMSSRKAEEPLPAAEGEPYGNLSDYTTAHMWHDLEGDYYAESNFYHCDYDYGNEDMDYDEDGIPRRCFLTSLPRLNDEEARQLEMADTSSGVLDVRFEPVLRAAIQREARELAATAAAQPPPLPTPPPSPPSTLHQQQQQAIVQLAAEDPLRQANQLPPPPQLAENAVFGISTYRISIPLRYLDHAIIWSFSLITLILLRRAVWGMLSALWSAP